jgi:hypothetical protein
MRERTMMRTEMTSDSGQGFTIVFLDVAIIKADSITYDYHAFIAHDVVDGWSEPISNMVIQ